MQELYPNRTFTERRPTTALTPAYEDFGLFKSEVLPVEVALTPAMHRTTRHDLVIRGVTTTGQGFEVVFAGRRTAMAASLVSVLEDMRRAHVAAAADPKGAARDLDSVQLPAVVEGVWRRRHWIDETGWQHYANQLVAARWSIAGADGQTLTFGASPANSVQPVRSAVMGHRSPGERGDIQKAAGGN